MEFTIVDYSDTINPGIICYDYTNGETTPNQLILTGGITSTEPTIVLGTQINHDFIKGGKYRIEYTASTLKVYENDVLLASASNVVGFPTRFELHTSNIRFAIVKDLRVKAL